MSLRASAFRRSARPQYSSSTLDAQPLSAQESTWCAMVSIWMFFTSSGANASLAAVDAPSSAYAATKQSLSSAWGRRAQRSSESAQHARSAMTTSASPAQRAHRWPLHRRPRTRPPARRPARGLGGERRRRARRRRPRGRFPRVGVGDESSRAAVLGDERPRERASVRGAREVGHAQAFDAARAPRVAPRAAAQPERGADRLGGHHAPRRAVSLRRSSPPAPRGSRGSRARSRSISAAARPSASDRDARDDSGATSSAYGRRSRAQLVQAPKARQYSKIASRGSGPEPPSDPTAAGVRGYGSQRRAAAPRATPAPRAADTRPLPRLSRRPSRPPRPRARRPARPAASDAGLRRAGQGPPPRRATRAPGARTAGGVAGGGVRVAAREGASCQRRRCTHHRRACAGHRYVQRGAHGLPVIGRALQTARQCSMARGAYGAPRTEACAAHSRFRSGGHGHALYAQGAFQELERLFALPTLTQNARVHQARLAVAHRATRPEPRTLPTPADERGAARGSVGSRRRRRRRPAGLGAERRRRPT